MEILGHFKQSMPITPDVVAQMIAAAKIESQAMRTGQHVVLSKNSRRSKEAGQSEAEALARATDLRNLWKARGYAVSTWVEKISGGGCGQQAIFVVRSDTKNGLPRGRRR